jgi:hypothetical protein
MNEKLASKSYINYWSNATPEFISKFLASTDWRIRRAAIRHPKATPEHILAGLNDESGEVKRAACEAIRCKLNTPGWEALELLYMEDV